MMARSMFGMEMEKQGEILNRVSSLVDERTLRTTACTRFAWSELPQAIALQESGKAIGKIVLTVAF
jgi:NADPH:quinone reductase-like Zn-dependent oxidoreductase